MKKILILLLSLSALTAHASLETFFAKLEGRWENVSMEGQRETAEGEITTSEGTHFSADVVREGNRWNFTEDYCWVSEGTEACGQGELAYEVDGDELTVIMNEEKFPVTVLENDDEHILLMLSTNDFVFTADLTLDGQDLQQNSVMEFGNGDKEYQLLGLRKR